MAASGSAVYDVSNGSKGLLSTLPVELQHLVFDYLFPTHQTGFINGSGEPIPFPRSEHPILKLAQTSRQLRAETQAWAKHFLLRYANGSPYSNGKRLATVRNPISGRGSLLEWMTKRCVFCGKKSVRTAILANGMHCCRRCDRDQWPDKITRTDAKAAFDLRDHHPPSRSHRQLRVAPPCSLRYGTYLTSNVLTTMFLRHEVRALAELVHGDLETHLEKRRAAKEARKKNALVGSL